MDKETAEIYVLYGIKSTNFTKKMCLTFLPLNIVLSGISIILLDCKYTVVIVFTILILGNIVTSIIFVIKWSAFFLLFAQSTQFTFLIIILNFIYYGLQKISLLFVWYEFLISLIIQVIAFVVSILLVINQAKNQKKVKKKSTKIMAGSAAVLSFSIGRIICRFFLTNATFSIVSTILSILLNIMICLLSYAIVCGYYRAYLMKKFDLKINLRVEK